MSKLSLFQNRKIQYMLLKRMVTIVIRISSDFCDGVIYSAMTSFLLSSTVKSAFSLHKKSRYNALRHYLSETLKTGNERMRYETLSATVPYDKMIF